jgi:DNA-binding MarR family transcriptional regulator
MVVITAFGVTLLRPRSALTTPMTKPPGIDNLVDQKYVRIAVVGSPGSTTDLPFLLLGGFHQLISDLHTELARQGHPDARPVHGFALQAIGRSGCSVTDLGRTLGVTKQAAAKTAAGLERLGYVERRPDLTDGRALVLCRTPHGDDLLRRSARVLGRLRREWMSRPGTDVDALETTLRLVLADRPPASLEVPALLH